MITVFETEEVDRSCEVNEGSGLKYPAVKVQDEVLNVGQARAWRIVRIAGSSVEVSGSRSWDSWETG